MTIMKGEHTIEKKKEGGREENSPRVPIGTAFLSQKTGASRQKINQLEEMN